MAKTKGLVIKERTVGESDRLVTLLSPRRGEVSVAKARRFADEPEFTSETYLTPRYLPNSFSNLSQYLPAVSQNSSAESTRFVISLLSNTRLA